MAHTPADHNSAISIGLLYIPVNLYETGRDISILSYQLCKNSNKQMHSYDDVDSILESKLNGYRCITYRDKDFVNPRNRRARKS